MKVGRNFARAKEALIATGMAERAIYVERATMAGEVVTPLCQKQDDFRTLFLPHTRAGEGPPAVSGHVMVVGLGPGPAEWMTPEASAAIKAATDVVGYGPYVERLALRTDQRAHTSDNRIEMDRARFALSSRPRAVRSPLFLAAIRACSRWRRRCSRPSKTIRNG